MNGMSHTEILDNLNNLEKKQVLSIQFARRIADALKEHSLEPDWMTTDGIITFGWHPQVFNLGHIAEIEIDNGIVTAVMFIKESVTQGKFWYVRDFIDATCDELAWEGPDFGALVLTLAETIECIRHHIWANHNL